MTLNKEERENLIIKKIPLTIGVVKRLSKLYQIDIHEIESYAYEGLIIGIDKYDENKNTNLDRYLLTYINSYILKGIAINNDHCYKNIYFDFLKVKNEIEEKYNTSLEQNIEILPEMIELLIQQNIITKKYAKRFEEWVLFSLKKSLIQLKNDLIYEEDTILYSVYENIIKEQINNILNILDEKTRNIIIDLYGLDGTDAKALGDINQKYGYSIEGIRQIRNKALRKLKYSKYSKQLHSMLEIIDNHHVENLIKIYTK